MSEQKIALPAISQFMIKGKATSADFAKCRFQLYEMGIKTSYDKQRMIFNISRGNNDFVNEYIREASGLVLDMETWRPLVVPPQTLCYYADKKFVDSHINDYKVYSICDGTRINLYYWQDRWIMSSNSNFEVNNVKWNGDKTYQELFVECLSKMNSAYDSFDKFTLTLDTKYSYTFGFKHKDMHPFYEGLNDYPFRVWFIQMVNLDTLEITCESKFDSINSQPALPTMSCSTMFSAAKNALDLFIDEGKVNFGFILRATKPHGKYSNYCIESSLLKKIRLLQYDKNLIDVCHENKYNKEDFLVLNAFMDIENSLMFKLLFKQFTKQFDEFDRLFKIIVGYMLMLSNNGNNYPGDDATDEQKITFSIAQTIYNKFIMHVSVNLQNMNDEQKTRTLYEYIIHPNHRMPCERLLALLH